MTNEEKIIRVKEIRVELDKIFVELSSIELNIISRSTALAITKIEEGKMWLGKTLSNLGGSTPYPDADNPENTNVDPTADTGK